MNAPPPGLTTTLGMSIVTATAEEVVLEWDVQPLHHQPMGIVHGGVHCAAIETACSIGAHVAASQRDPNMSAVGLENHTSFIRAVRSGRLKVVATPVTRGRTSQVWEARVLDEEDKVVARGTVRLLNVPFSADIG